MLGTDTMTWLNDAAPTEENAFTAGTLDLRVKDNNEG